MAEGGASGNKGTTRKSRHQRKCFTRLLLLGTPSCTLLLLAKENEDCDEMLDAFRSFVQGNDVQKKDNNKEHRRILRWNADGHKIVVVFEKYHERRCKDRKADGLENLCTNAAGVITFCRSTKKNKENQSQDFVKNRHICKLVKRILTLELISHPSSEYVPALLPGVTTDNFSKYEGIVSMKSVEIGPLFSKFITECLTENIGSAELRLQKKFEALKISDEGYVEKAEISEKKFPGPKTTVGGWLKKKSPNWLGRPRSIIYNCDQLILNVREIPGEWFNNHPALKDKRDDINQWVQNTYGEDAKKEQLSLHVCVNSDGSDPRDILKIGTDTTFCSRGFDPHYRYYSESRMNEAFVSPWLKNFHDCFGASSKFPDLKTVLLFDIYSGQNVVIETDNVEILVFPKNETKMLQPLDKEIPIVVGGKNQNMSVLFMIKEIYYDLVAAAWYDLFRPGTTASKSQQEQPVTMKEILEWVDLAWKDVPVSSIREAFDEALYLKSKCSEPLAGA